MMDYRVDRVLVVGLGSIGRRHVNILKRLKPNAQIAVLRHNSCTEIDIQALEGYECYTNIDAALHFKPQVAILANPTFKHLEVAMRLAASGIHLLIEKPISDSSEGVQDLLALCEKKKCTVMVGYNLRFLPSLVLFRELLWSGKVGQVYSVQGEVGQYLPSWRPETDYRNTISAQKQLGGGVLLELSHEIDYLSWVFGPVNWVVAKMARKSSLDIDVEDTVTTIIGLQDRSGQEILATLNMDFIRHDTTRKCIAIGERGSLAWDGIGQSVHFYPKGGTAWEEIYAKKQERDYTYEAQIRKFFEQVETRRQSVLSGEEGLKVIEVVEAIRRSSKSGTVVSLQE